MPNCKYIHSSGLPCENKVMTKPDKTQPSVYLICEPQAENDRKRFVWIFPSVPVSDFCYYHDRIMARAMEPHTEFYSYTNKLRYKQWIDEKSGSGFKIFHKEYTKPMVNELP